METTQTLTPSASDGYLAVGTLLNRGRYRVERYLASGGFGKTYVVTDRTFGQLVVLKEFFIKGVCVRNADGIVVVSQADNELLFNAQREKFHKEARRLHDIEHPNIVRVYDLFAENGTSYYTMTYIEGESLAERLERSGAMPEAQVWPILDQLLDALAYIHERHIWHLDLKPNNVLIDAAGHVSLIDFGASKMVDNDNGGTMHTSTAVAFTPGFAPLEQVARDFSGFGPWTDFYALGATIYNIVSAQRVPTTSEIVTEGVGAFAFPLQTSKKLRNLIEWLMKPSHKARPQSVAALRAKIIGTQKKIVTPKSTKSEYKDKNIANWWWAVVVVVVVIGVFALPSHRVSDIAPDSEVKLLFIKSGTINGHDYVDLALPSGTLWAACNVGASSPEEFGDYYAWGETKVKDSYNWDTYFDASDGGKRFKKYNNGSGKTELDVTDDVANAKWGGAWLIPSRKQFNELFRYCDLTYTTLNGVQGVVFKSKMNNNFIFLPEAGCIGNYGGPGYDLFYWGRFMGIDDTDGAFWGRRDGVFLKGANKSREYGCSVRPVCKPSPQK